MSPSINSYYNSDNNTYWRRARKDSVQACPAPPAPVEPAKEEEVASTVKEEVAEETIPAPVEEKKPRKRTSKAKAAATTEVTE